MSESVPVFSQAWPVAAPLFMRCTSVPSTPAIGSESSMARELAALRLAVEMTRSVRVGDAVFDEARAALADDSILVELVATIAAYNMVSRVIVALGIEPEQASAKP